MSITAFNPIVDGYELAPNPGSPAPVSTGAPVPGVGVQTDANPAAIQGTRPLSGLHNTPLHMALLGVAALLIVIAIRTSGFRFSTVGKIAVGR